MYSLSLTTVRDRWVLFVGAIVTVCIGVALVQASLLTLIAAATPDIAVGLTATQDLLVRDGYIAAVTVMSMVLGISTFVAMFIVGSTFAFTVAQRRGDFALLRLIGASRRQVRRLLFGEAVVLGAIGTALGVALGIYVARFEANLLIDLDFVPAGFNVAWRTWILAVSCGVGLTIAVAGSLGAAHRAGKVRPLEALQATAKAERVMTVWRWLIGLTASGGAIAMMIIAPGVGSEAALALSMTVCMVWVIALAALSPIIVPLIGGLVGLTFKLLVPGSRVGELIRANLRDGVRRSVSTATPIMLMVGLVVGLAGATDVMSAGTRSEAILTLNGDLVVTATQPIGDQLAAVGGIDTVSEEMLVVVGVDEEPGEAESYVAEFGVAIDPLTYPRTHNLSEVDGNLAALHGDTVVLSRGLASTLATGVGETVRLRLDGIERELLVIATIKDTLAGPQVLLPLANTPVNDEPHRYIIQATSPALTTGVAAQITAISPADPGLEVVPLDEWIDTNSDAQERANRNIIIAIVALAALYSAIAIVNTVVISAADRHQEFAIARLTGMSRTQVVRATLWESLTVTTAGVLLGTAVAAATVLGVTAAVSDIVGTRVTATPWSLLAITTTAAAALVSITSVLTSLAATRQPPIAVAATRQ